MPRRLTDAEVIALTDHVDRIVRERRRKELEAASVKPRPRMEVFARGQWWPVRVGQ